MKAILFALFLLLNTTIFAQSLEIKSPNELPKNDQRTKIFLGGTIDMGNSEDWQAKVSKELKNEKVILLNPRRDDWNTAWKPVKEEPEFRKQVEWELNALENADYIIMFFGKDSKSPISLLEMGLYAKSGKLLVICPDGFWRKGNVDITAEKYGVKQFDSIENVLDYLKNILK
ncbi:MULTISPECIES: nucleoside 2-deoxyribosyltransferase domain-containing protein [Empedobacter]|uniref:Nucleoside 2-deoxyribosyltransferase n=1 Tax=Empedobacter falsenii TaxID=343874 RepID=A0A3R8TS71_9FLAO|nr:MULTISPECIES: nucleoside 2-deoxyribosyltransferase domain-containing protein [Empedobacter]MDH0659942.1 nucleoside 2-deoxyribosyltransferase domain-containing protein [Empedobacter sp. GD03865]MDH1883186.1 nucleoside 2-deoxyribosyltransferase domain-containing protein [Empedobacter sp. GD03797]RRT94602.1 hypothetical protein EGI89_00900 [Empedobacter falsenii]RRT94848.1 hypothetical protein EGI88_00905 [Empedobacter falsenii]